MFEDRARSRRSRRLPAPGSRRPRPARVARHRVHTRRLTLTSAADRAIGKTLDGSRCPTWGLNTGFLRPICHPTRPGDSSTRPQHPGHRPTAMTCRSLWPTRGRRAAGQSMLPKGNDGGRTTGFLVFFWKRATDRPRVNPGVVWAESPTSHGLIENAQDPDVCRAVARIVHRGTGLSSRDRTFLPRPLSF